MWINSDSTRQDLLVIKGLTIHGRQISVKVYSPCMIY